MPAPVAWPRSCEPRSAARTLHTLTPRTLPVHYITRILAPRSPMSHGAIDDGDPVPWARWPGRCPRVGDSGARRLPRGVPRPELPVLRSRASRRPGDGAYADRRPPHTDSIGHVRARPCRGRRREPPPRGGRRAGSAGWGPGRREHGTRPGCPRALSGPRRDGRRNGDRTPPWAGDTDGPRGEHRDVGRVRPARPNHIPLGGGRTRP